MSDTVVLLRIEKLLTAQLERMAAMHADQSSLHNDIRQLLAALVHKTSNGSTVHTNESDSP